MEASGKWENSEIGILEISKFGRYGNRRIRKMRNVETFKVERLMKGNFEDRKI